MQPKYKNFPTKKIFKRINPYKLSVLFLGLCEHEGFLERFGFTIYVTFFICLFRSFHENQLL